MPKYSFWVVFERDYLEEDQLWDKKYLILARVPHLLGTVATHTSLTKARMEIKDALQGSVAAKLKGGDVVKSDLKYRKPRSKKAVAIEYITVEVRKPTKKKKPTSHRSKDSSDWLMEDI